MINPQKFISSVTLEHEQWAPIKDFESRYWISTLGRIISHDHRKRIIHLLNSGIDDRGYIAVALRHKPLHRRTRVHVLVAETFLDKPDLGGIRITVNHKNGIKTDNRLVNLEWISAAENVAHAVAMGLFNIKGSKHPLSKVDEDDVREMRRLHSIGWIHKDIAAKFGICRRQAGDIINGVNWGHVI